MCVPTLLEPELSFRNALDFKGSGGLNRAEKLLMVFGPLARRCTDVKVRETPPRHSFIFVSFLIGQILDSYHIRRSTSANLPVVEVEVDWLGARRVIELPIRHINAMPEANDLRPYSTAEIALRRRYL